MKTAIARTAAIAPGPRGNLLMGNVKEYIRDPIAMLMRLRREYGDVARNVMGPYLTHLVSHPDHVKYVLQDNHANYIRGRFYDNFKPFFGDGLLTTDGDFWLRHRKAVQPLFYKTYVETCSHQIIPSVNEMLNRWEQYSCTGKAFDIVPEFMQLTLSVLGRMTFGIDLGAHASTIGPAVRLGVSAMMPQGNLNDFIPRWLPTPHNSRISTARHTLTTIMRLVREERARHKQMDNDLTSLLMSIKDDDTHQRLTEKEVEDEMMTIFLAGHETTGSGLAWALYALSMHPEVRIKLEDELSRTLGERPPTADDLPNLPYLCMVIDESLRVCPPIWGFTRDAVNDDEIGGYRIPAGSSVFVSPYVTHRHTDFWSNPEAFDPEHFRPELVEARPRFAYFPFGGGQRQCIGIHMAKLQMRIAVAMIVQRFRFQPVPGHPIERGASVSLRPLKGIMMNMQPMPRKRVIAGSTGTFESSRSGQLCPFAH